MSRRKAGCTPRRVDPAPASSTDDEMEMPDLVIEVKPEPDARPLQAAGLGLFSPKEVPAPAPAPGRFDGEARHSPGPEPVPAGSPLHALGARNQWALWTPLIGNPRGERPLPLPRLPPASLGAGAPSSRLRPPTPYPRPGLISPAWSRPPAPILTFGFSLTVGTPSPHPGPTPRLPPASSQQTASPGRTNTQIC